jgi:DNA-binding CsgD family transcriptional regulator
MMSSAQSWDAVLSIQHDIERIVSQAVRGGRCRLEDSEDAVNTAMVTSVALAERYDGTIGTFAAYALGTLRRELLHGRTRSIDALDRVNTAEIPEHADISAQALENSRGEVTSLPVNFQDAGILTPLENRVVSLKIAGKSLQWIAAHTGLQLRQVAPMIGKAASKIRSSGTTSRSSNTTADSGATTVGNKRRIK